ncbi:hypothetical protein HYH03_000776 [Edaphochlamys debaryana]|uniref:FAS1 domain-containing protein n=1 Tax=Edaphochlamys debaryana TaxID=47281 RepID=A0A836C6Q0_9CHLO|nr:hypothetical protein HYH03_000776 [Edaphochlamys debaryana]|eukprot:KAG2500952.1 hypothetical protein HYH03_000776 [Edaphochlamys debaryana]
MANSGSLLVLLGLAAYVGLADARANWLTVGGGLGTGGPRLRGHTVASPPGSILELLASRPDTQLLYQLIDSVAEIKAVAADPSTAATFFAPTDAAINSALADLGLSVDVLIQGDPQLLATILSYHTVPGAAYATTDLPRGLTVAPTVYSSAEISLYKNAAGVHIRGVESEADVTLPNLAAGKSLVHLIDYVLLPYAIDVPYTSGPAPLLDTPEGALAARSDCTIALGLIRSTPLSDPRPSDPGYVATYLIPTDTAFRTFLAAAGMSEEELEGMRAADREALLAYHVVPFMALKTADLEEGADYRVPTSLLFQSLTLTRAGSAVSAKGVMSSANVVAGDILAGKAVIHIIDGVLLASEAVFNTEAAVGVAHAAAVSGSVAATA